MRKKIKTVIKEYHDENVVCFDVSVIATLLEYVRSSGLSAEALSKIVSNILEHGEESYALTSSDYEHLIK